MKGFPNQAAELAKLAAGVRALIHLLDAGQNPKDDDVFGPALVRAGVAGTGHGRRVPVEQYIRQQLALPPQRRSFGATARGLRELYELLGFVRIDGRHVWATELGRRAAAFADAPVHGEPLAFWRRVLRNMSHDGGDGEESHPYQVLLRLVGRRPGITRAKCALALEAGNDSTEELHRIVALADLPEDGILHRIRDASATPTAHRATQSNWDNAKKVLPSLAEQLGDVVVTRHGRERTYRLAAGPGQGEAGAAPTAPAPAGAPRGAAPRAPRGSRAVTADTIGRAGTAARDDPEFQVPRDLDPAAVAEASRLRLDRLRRHNEMVRLLARRLAATAQLHEDPFDLLGMVGEGGILVEVKTLDGTAEDERERVRDALGQLLYYEPFAAAPLVGDGTIVKIACFESAVSPRHAAWLNGSDIGVIWLNDRRDGFLGDESARRVLGRYLGLEELR